MKKNNKKFKRVNKIPKKTNKEKFKMKQFKKIDHHKAASK